MKGLQRELLSPEIHPTALAAILARLPQRELVNVSDVAVACNVSVSTVYSWLEAGDVESINLGGRDRAYFKLFRPSVVRFLQRRAGAEPAARPRP
jgi:hypothetical protein